MTEERLTLYSIDRCFALELKAGNNAVFIADSNLLKKDGLIDYHVKNNQIKSGINQTINIPLEKLERYDSLFNLNTYLFKNYIAFGERRLVIINKNNDYLSADLYKTYPHSLTDNKYEFDYINNNSNFDIKQSSYSNDRINNSQYSTKRLKTNLILLAKKGNKTKENILKVFETDFIILCNTLNPKEKDWFYKQYKENNEQIWDVKNKGAFIINN